MHKKNEVIDLEYYRAGETDGSLETSQNLPEGTTLLLGQYKITSYLNCGGFGITYRAQDSLNREVVIKECFPAEMAFRDGKLMGARTPKFKEELDSIVECFVKEAHRLANVQHNNIVHVHQVFEENGTAYMAMDYIDGPDLLDILADDPNRFAPRDVERLARKMLRAIKYVHDCGMLHRDISPDNILIDANDEPILIDFGAAREYASQATRSFSKLKFVKDGYSPQEFYIAGSEQSEASDIYSFAASLYHLITGQAPEVSQKRLAALAARKPDPYVPLAGNVTGYSTRFLKTVDKAMRILPEHRIPTADKWLSLLSVKKKNAAIPTEMQPEAEPIVAAPANRNGVFDVLFGSKQAVASVAAAFALLGAVAVVVTQSGQNSADTSQIALSSSQTPSVETVLVDNPRLALVDPLAGGLPERAPVTMDAIIAGASAIRIPTPPTFFAPPILQATPKIGTMPELTMPEVVFNQPPLPSGLLPVNRVAQSMPLGVPETLAAPSVPSAGIEAMAAVPLQSDIPNVPTGLSAQPKATLAAALPQAEVETLPGAIETVLPDAILAADLAVQTVGFTPSSFDDNGTLTFAAMTNVARSTKLAALPMADAEAAFVVDSSAPPPFEKFGTVAPVQVAFAHWDVKMPFEAQLSRVRNANTAQITTVSDTADLSMSGDWIEKGVILYSFNGERLEENTPISSHVLKSLSIDPDGYARATVRYRNPTKGILDRGLLSVPVVRTIGLADGTIIEARIADQVWVFEVTVAGEHTTGLQVGDVLKAETLTGVTFSEPGDLTKALDDLVARNMDTADMTVVRNGTRQQAAWHLAREVPSASR